MKKGSRVKLSGDITLKASRYGQENIKVSPDKPCFGTVKSMRYRKYGKTNVLLITFAPDVCPEERYEFNAKYFIELEEED